jgi:RNA polymerase sigma-70 factor (ECF subfamily)
MAAVPLRRTDVPREPEPDDADAREQLVALYRAHGTTVYGLALRYGGGDTAWAEDVTQEVFCDLYGRVDRVSRMDNPGGWIYRATTSRCLNRLRDDRRRRARVEQAARTQSLLAGSLEAQGEARDRLMRLFEVVGDLPPRERVCFWMHHADGLGVSEIGAILGHSKGYVSKLLTRARAMIERALPGTESDP